MFYFGKKNKPNKPKEGTGTHTNPFKNLAPVDIQVGVSPEIIEDIPIPPDFDDNRNSGIFNWFNTKSPAEAPEKSLKETYSHSLYETVQGFSSRFFASGSTTYLSGHLTADEFIRAGEHLVANNDTWEWAFESDNMNSKFPPDRQYLVNRGLSCHVRSRVAPQRDRVHLDHKSNELWTCPQAPDREAVDEVHIYDMSLTYDETNRTPRVWLVGYSEEGKPLSMEDIARDIDIEFVGTVATMIPHPYTGVLNVSIHPCRHAEGMARIIERQQKAGHEFNIEHYMVHFLTLIACIFPAIDLS